MVVLSLLSVNNIYILPQLWKEGLSWSWSYVRWIYNYLCNQCISPL